MPGAAPLPPKHSAMVLSEALRAANLPDMAHKAAAGYYHDYLSPFDFPELALDKDLLAETRKGNVQAALLRQRHHNGEFDATYEESTEWAGSAEGKNIFARLLR